MIAPGFVKSRALVGIKALALRVLACQILRIVSSLCLARLLYPSDYGLFGVVAYLTGVGMFVGDVGLSGALVRQEREPTEDETFTVFWFHQLLTGAIVGLIVLTAPALVHVYALSSVASRLLTAMAGGLFLTSLRVVPAMLLERQLRFSVIARCELIESIALTVSTIALAALGFGAWALAGGAMIRSAVGLGCIWFAVSWRPRGRFYLPIVRRLLTFGLAYQLNTIVPALVAGWVPLIVGRMLGTVGVGLVNWASGLASMPLMMSAVLNKVAFPAYSRLQNDPLASGRYLQLTVRRLGAVLWLVIPIMVLVCAPGIRLLFGTRWVAAIPLVQWFSLECIVLTQTGILASVQNASGRPGDRLWVVLVFGGVRWVLAYGTVACFGLAGVGPAMFLVSVSELAVTAFLVSRRTGACCGILSEVVRPMATAGTTLLAALGIGRVTAGAGVLPQTALSLLVFVCLIVLTDLATGGKPLFREVRALLMMLRPACDTMGA